MPLVTPTWLENSNRRCLLVEFTINKITSSAIGTDTTGTGTQTLFYSTSGFLTTSSDVFYQPLMNEGFSFTESLSVDGGISITYGDVELSNKNGDLDDYLDNSKYVWVNGSVNIYYGDPNWILADLAAVRTEFDLIFSGVIADIDSRNEQSINIKIRDKLERLNTPITEDKIGVYGTWGSGNQTNIDNIKPIVFGEVFNISPVLIDPAPGAGAAEFYAHNGLTERIIEVRDNGVPVTLLSSNLTTGKFVLDKPFVGTVTMDLQGQKSSITLPSGANPILVLAANTYANTIASTIALIVTQYGSATNKLTLSEIDGENFYQFNVANTQPIGILITDRENTLEVCNRIAGSVGAQLFMTRLGKLQLIRYGVATADASTAITTTDIILDSLTISNRSLIGAATKVGYGKNWTVQPNLITSIPQAHKDSYATEWYSVTSTNNTVKTLYKLDAEPEQKDTLLIVTSDATTEAARLNTIFSQTKTTYKFTGTARLLQLKLGQPVTLTHPRFGLSAGPTGQVVSLTPNWSAGTIDVEVLI